MVLWLFLIYQLLYHLVTIIIIISNFSRYTLIFMARYWLLRIPLIWHHLFHTIAVVNVSTSKTLTNTQRFLWWLFDELSLICSLLSYSVLVIIYLWGESTMVAEAFLMWFDSSASTKSLFIFSRISPLALFAFRDSLINLLIWITRKRRVWIARASLIESTCPEVTNFLIFPHRFLSIGLWHLHTIPTYDHILRLMLNLQGADWVSLVIHHKLLNQ